MRIGIATHNYPPHLGGLETLVRELAERFARHHDVVVVSTAWETARGVTRENGVTVHRVPAWHGLERAGVPYAVPVGPGAIAAYRALRSCDVLHAHGCLYLTSVLAVLAQRTGVPLFVTEHVGAVPYHAPALRAVQRVAWAVIGDRVARGCAGLIAYNARVEEYLRQRFPREQVHFIGNGVDVDVFHPPSDGERAAARQRLGLPSDAVLGLFVGREAEKKNLEAVLQSRSQHYQLVVCGAVRHLPDGVLNLGAVPHAVMSDVYAATDFMIHAAVGEGFPVAVQEAAASGLPVVLLWDVGYARAISRDCVRAIDTLDQLTEATTTLATTKTLRRELGQAARAFAAHQWNWDTTIERHLHLFQSALLRAA